MGFQPRIPTSFESIDATTILTFAIAEFEWQSDQALTVPSLQLVGTSYPFDQLGLGQPVKQEGREQLRYIFLETDPASVDSDVDDLTSKLVTIGLGKLWLTDRNGTRRWAYARASSMPSLRWMAGDIFKQAATIQFRRQSDWFASALTTGSIALAASPTAFTITNPGTVRARAMTLTLASGSAAGFSAPSLQNQSLLLTFSTSRNAASVNDRLQIMPHIGSVQYSTNAGVTYANDYGLVTLPAGQVPLMELDPGINNLSYTSGGTPNASLSWSFYAPYH